MITDPQEAEIRKIQDAWVTERQSVDAQRAAMKKQQEEDQKKAIIEQAQQKAQAAKDKAAADKAGKGKSPATPPATTGATMQVPATITSVTTQKPKPGKKQ